MFSTKLTSSRANTRRGLRTPLLIVLSAATLFIASCSSDLAEPTPPDVGSSAEIPDTAETPDPADTSPETADASPETTPADQAAQATPADDLSTDESATGDPQTTDESNTTDATPDVAIERLNGAYTVEIVSTRPHDANAYTQGLEFDGDRLLETTGLYGESDRRWIDPVTGDVLEIVDLPDELFGEGVTVVDGEIRQLTWKAGVVLSAAPDTLIETGRDNYAGEGWGLCFDGTQLAMSDGSSTLTLRDPATFDATSTVTVVDAAGQPVTRLNELECVGDQVLANVYGLDTIVVINPTSGAVDATIDAASLRPSNAPADDFNYVLNGIAFDEATGHYFLTGKWWDVMYEVRLVPQAN